VSRRIDRHGGEEAPAPLCNCIVGGAIEEVNGVPEWHATKGTFGGVWPHGQWVNVHYAYIDTTASIRITRELARSQLPRQRGSITAGHLEIA
jgi:hypothetical protein